MTGGPSTCDSSAASSQAAEWTSPTPETSPASGDNSAGSTDARPIHGTTSSRRPQKRNGSRHYWTASGVRKISLNKLVAARAKERLSADIMVAQWKVKNKADIIAYRKRKNMALMRRVGRKYNRYLKSEWRKYHRATIRQHEKTIKTSGILIKRRQINEPVQIRRHGNVVRVVPIR